MKTDGQTRVFTAVVEYDEDSRMYVASVPSVRGAHTQAATLEELHERLKEVIALCLEEFHEDVENQPRFVGLQQIEVTI